MRRLSGRSRFALGALLGAVAVAFADSSIVVLALPDMLRQFHASLEAVAWVITAYNLALAVASLGLVFGVRRLGGIALVRAGCLLFFAGSVACGFASSLWPLVTFRSLQGIGGALLLAGSLALARVLASSPPRGTRLWARATVIGVTLGPACGGFLTQFASWPAIFFAQAPLAALGFLATFGSAVAPHTPHGEVAPSVRARDRLAANAALALASAGLVALLFLTVVLLIDVLHLSPLGAAAVVSTIPLATLAAQALPGHALPSSAAAGIVLFAAGLAGMAFLPATGIAWAVAALATAGIGVGLAVPPLTAIALSSGAPTDAAAPTTITARHIGLVAGLLVLTPLLAADLSSAGSRAKLQGIETVLTAPVSARTELTLALGLLPVLSHPPADGLPDVRAVLAPHRSPTLTAIGGRLDSVIEGSVTRGFRRSFLVAAALALLALVPLGLTLSPWLIRRSGYPLVLVALALAASLFAAEFASGAASYGQRPHVPAPCASPSAVGGSGIVKRRLLATLDTLSCELHTSPEELIVRLGRSPFGATVAGEIARSGTVPGWLKLLLAGSLGGYSSESGLSSGRYPSQVSLDTTRLRV